MIRVLYFLNSRTRGETEEHVLAIMQRLDRQTFIPTLVCPQELIDLMYDPLKEYKINAYPIDIRKWTDIGEMKDFLIILRKIRPSIVHTNDFYATQFAVSVSKYDHVPITIETVHKRELLENEDEKTEEEKKKAYKPRFIENKIRKNIDHYIAVADAVKKHLVLDKGIPNSKITVIRNGVDLERFHMMSGKTYSGAKDGEAASEITIQDQKVMNISEELRLKTENKLSIGVIGEVDEFKGHRYFIEAISKLGPRKENAIFLIFGDGKLKLPLRKMADQLGLTENVHFIGYQKFIHDVFNALDIVVIPSLSEGLPAIALQASSMGKAVISTDADGLPEAFINNETGLVVPAKNSDALSVALAKLIDNPGIRKQLGKNANQHMIKNFDVNKQIHETEALYKLLVSKSLC